MVPGIDETLRIRGRAELRDTAGSPVDLLEHGRPPRSVLVVTVDVAFMHCAKALMRGRLWDPEARVLRSAFPSAGEVMRAHTGADGPVETDQEMRLRYQTLL
jgi:predicted pyridoxine 5'-phosphate oxidase superfamily flavin-nucleotide-binding protein